MKNFSSTNMALDTTPIYLVANDDITEWLNTCLVSLHKYKKSARVFIIPYDNNLSETSKLIENFPNTSLVEGYSRNMDAFGEHIQTFMSADPNRQGHWRKLALFGHAVENGFNNAILSDADIIFTSDVVTTLYEIGSDADDLIYAERSPGHCYNDVGLRRYDSKEISSGFLFFCNVAKTFEQAKHIIKYCGEEYLEIRYEWCLDQPFFNMIVDKFNLKTRTLADLGYNPRCYYQAIDTPQRNGNKVLQNDLEVAFVHFAGITKEHKLSTYWPPLEPIFSELGID